jgi:hypothetical protein
MNPDFATSLLVCPGTNSPRRFQGVFQGTTTQLAFGADGRGNSGSFDCSEHSLFMMRHDEREIPVWTFRAYVAVLGAIAGWGQVAMCAEYLSSRIFSWQRGHWSTFISDRMFLPFQFLPLSFYTPLAVPLLYTETRFASAGFPDPATALYRQHDIRTLSLTTKVPSLHLFAGRRLLIVFGMVFLPESSRTFLKVRACNCSEEFSVCNAKRVRRENGPMNSFEAGV